MAGPSWTAGVTCGPGAGLGCPAAPGGRSAPRGRVRFEPQSGGESPKPGAERAFAGDPLGLVTHFIPVTTRARLERRPMGRRGGQLLRGTPALPTPGPRAEVRSPCGGCRRRWARPVSGRGSGSRSPGSARLGASDSGNCGVSRAPRAAPGLSNLRPPAPAHSLSPPRLAYGSLSV